MPDIRQTVRGAAPAVPDLDLPALRARAAAVRAADQRRQRRSFGGAAGALVLLLVLVASPLLRGGAGPAEVAVGQGEGPGSLRAVSGLSVTDPDGGTLSLADYPDIPLLVYVWAPWCGPCPDVLPDLQTVATELDDVAVVTVAIQTDREAVTRVLDDPRVDLPTILLEDAQALAPLLELPDGDPVPLATFTPEAQRVPLPTPTPTAVAGASELASPSDVLAGPAPSPLATPPAAVPLTVALDADHRVVASFYGAPRLDQLRQLGAQAASGSEPDAAPQPTSSMPDPTTTSPPTPGVVGTPSPTDGDTSCIPIDPPLIGVEGGTYEVQEGDTLAGIAEAVFGDPIAFSQIVEANSLDDTPIQVGQVLAIPSYPSTALCELPAVGIAQADRIDIEIDQGLTATAPQGWTPRPSSQPSTVEWESGLHWIRFTSIVPTAGRTPAEELQAALQAGEVAFDLSDGTPASFRNPPDTGRMLLLLPGDRLLEVASADPSATPIDYAWPDLMDWMVALSAALA